MWAELWWFAVVDAADLPPGASDSFDRVPGSLSVAPGTYEMTYHHDRDRTREDPHVVVAEIRRVEP